MKKTIVAFVVGFIFALGLGLSGMTNPNKVVGFLDLFGSFDPSLIFVMVGAIVVHFITYRIIRKRPSPVFEKEWLVPTKKDITPALILGSFIFGVGWALGGYCPGPALTSLSSLQTQPFIFIASMAVGMILFKFIDKQVAFKK